MTSVAESSGAPTPCASRGQSSKRDLESVSGRRSSPSFLQPETRWTERKPLDPEAGVLPADFTKDLQAGETVGAKPPLAAGAAAAAAVAEQRKGGSAQVQCQVPDWS